MSIAGGVDLSLQRGKSVRCETIQIFIKSNVQWRMIPLREGEKERFFAARRSSGIDPVFAHTSYLINLASANRSTRMRSITSLKREILRADELSLPYLVLHPGSHGGKGEEEGIRKITDGLDEVFYSTGVSGVRVLLETTAGQKNSVGGRFEQLAAIIASSGHRRLLGVCFDTCHVFVAGYDIRTAAGYRKVMKEFDRTIGLKKIKAVHLNDAKAPLGSRLDRHEQIGRGTLGMEAFRLILNDKRLSRVPMVLETPKGKEMREDRRNLAVLRALRGRKTVARGS